MKAEQLAIHSLSTAHRNLEEALDAYSAAGFRYVEPYLPLVRAWIEDGHAVDETRELFDARDLQLIASSERAPFRGLTSLRDGLRDALLDALCHTDKRAVRPVQLLSRQSL